MSRLNKAAFRAICWEAAACFLISMGLSGIYCQVFIGSGMRLEIVLWAAAAAGVLSACDHLLSGKIRAMLFAALICAEGIAFVMNRGSVFEAYQGLRALVAQLSGAENAAAVYADHLRALFTVLFVLLTSPMVKDDSFPFAAGCVALLFLVPFFFRQSAALLIYTLPSAAGLIMVFK